MYTRSTIDTSSNVLRCRLLPTDTYAYMEDLMRLDACRPSPGTLIPGTLRSIWTPLRWAEWDQHLESHPDQKIQGVYRQGLKRRFRIGFDYSLKCRASRRNMPSAEERAEVVREYLLTEVSAGRILGPLDPAKYPQVHTS